LKLARPGLGPGFDPVGAFFLTQWWFRCAVRPSFFLTTPRPPARPVRHATPAATGRPRARAAEALCRVVGVQGPALAEDQHAHPRAESPNLPEHIIMCPREYRTRIHEPLHAMIDQIARPIVRKLSDPSSPARTGGNGERASRIQFANAGSAVFMPLIS